MTRSTATHLEARVEALDVLVRLHHAHPEVQQVQAAEGRGSRQGHVRLRKKKQKHRHRGVFQRRVVAVNFSSATDALLAIHSLQTLAVTSMYDDEQQRLFTQTMDQFPF